MSIEFVIDRGVPLPPSNRVSWPFPIMEVGDSFVMPIRFFRKCMSAASIYNEKMQMEGKSRRITVRKLSPYEARCWCVEPSAAGSRRQVSYIDYK